MQDRKTNTQNVMMVFFEVKELQQVGLNNGL